MFAVPAPWQSTEGEVRAVAEPAALMRAPDELRDVFRSGMRFTCYVERADAWRVIVSSANLHDALRRLLGCHGDLRGKCDRDNVLRSHRNLLRRFFGQGRVGVSSTGASRFSVFFLRPLRFELAGLVDIRFRPKPNGRVRYSNRLRCRNLAGSDPRLQRLT